MEETTRVGVKNLFESNRGEFGNKRKAAHNYDKTTSMREDISKRNELETAREDCYDDAILVVTSNDRPITDEGT